MTYDNIKSHKKPGFYPHFINTFFEKPQRGHINCQAVLRLMFTTEILLKLRDIINKS